MTDPIDIQIPWLRYDVTLPIVQGRVKIDGFNLVPSLTAPGGTIFKADSPLKTGDFGLVDMNIANWLPGMEAGWEFIGLPIFPKRKHFYTYLFCRTDRGINGPKDLEGKRVLTTLTGSAVSLWLKALLEESHGVDVTKINWISLWEQWPLHTHQWTWKPLGSWKSPVQAMLDDDADAVGVDISDRKLYAQLENDPRFKRVLPDYLGEHRRDFEQSHSYLPVHILVMSRKLDRQYPELAGKLVAAFEQAKQLSYDDILDDRSGFGVIDLRERFVAQQQQWGDLFTHGIAANRKTLDRFMALEHRYGCIKAIPRYDEVFAHSTLDT